jgi:hypothetical protein
MAEIETSRQRQKVPFSEQLRALGAAYNVVEKTYADWLMQKRVNITKEGRDRHLAALNAVIRTIEWMQENDGDARGLARQIAYRQQQERKAMTCARIVQRPREGMEATLGEPIGRSKP